MSAYDIAIVGLSFELPQSAKDEESFWNILETGKNLMTEWPHSRLNVGTFHSESAEQQRTLYSRGAHFLESDPTSFDAPFFGITTKEAMALDPQQRHLLEASYRAFENAGITIRDLRGSKTAVFAASMSDDYSRMQAKDPDSYPQMAATGSAYSLQSNRISWYFDLRGPSVHVDTACSGSLVALDLACQCLQTGNASTALVAGVSLLLGPDTSLLLSGQRFLSPDSVCHSFDSRANGYSRGEGCVALVLKPILSAIQDGDMIRAIIRSTGTNQDGRTPGLTQPSAEAQEALIRDVYLKAGLDMADTRYVEAHGTGTAIGDPTEVKAIRNAFGDIHTAQQPLYIGSVKSNIGHLEGCSGLAGIIKAIKILEKGIIPPTALIEKINPAISKDLDMIQIPTENTPWPTRGLRRVSVNSFGFGGTNAHAVLDDVYHYLLHRKLPSQPFLTQSTVMPIEDGSSQPTSTGESSAKHATGSVHQEPSESLGLQLLVWTAPDEKAIARVMHTYQSYYSGKVLQDPDKSSRVRRLAYTLGAKRNRMVYRTFAVLNSGPEVLDNVLQVSRSYRASSNSQIAYIFTGQGAQYASMGYDLVRYPCFKNTLKRIDALYQKLGCTWSVIDKLRKSEDIDQPEYSQPVCTALQLALLELLSSFGIRPKVVLGHSSGEIAAAYAAGALSLPSACKVAYLRGKLAGKLKATTGSGVPGAMVSVNLPPSEIANYLDTLGLPGCKEAVHIACYNSPSNCTLSGAEKLIDTLEASFTANNIFSRKLSTGVAYHSPAMNHIAHEYLALMGSLEGGDENWLGTCRMISTVTGELISPTRLAEPQYWVDNLLHPVRFSGAMQTLLKIQSNTARDAVLDVIEIGPHTTLRTSVLDSTKGSNQIRYSHVLSKFKPALQTAVELAGLMFCYGYPVLIPIVNQHNGLIPLADCPGYPFDHSQKFWAESRLSRDYRFRGGVPSNILGQRFHDWNPLEPRWRNFFSVESSPWTGDHIISETVVLPAAGMVVMALEAIKQTSSRQDKIQGFYIQQADFKRPLVVGKSFVDRTETMLHLSPLKRPYEREVTWFLVKIHGYFNEEWRECFQSTIQVQYHEESGLDENHSQRDGLHGMRSTPELDISTPVCEIPVECDDFYEYWASHGIHYGDSFRLLRTIVWDGVSSAKAVVEAHNTGHSTVDVVHPTVLDAALQVLLVQASKGLSAINNTCVPRHLTNSWISGLGWAQSNASALHITSLATPRPGKGGLRGALQIVADDGSLLGDFKNITMATISSDNQGNLVDQRLLYNIQWRPQLSMLDSDQLKQQFSKDSYAIKDEIGTKNFRQLLNRKLEKIICRTHSALSQGTKDQLPQHLQRYIQWMENNIRQGCIIEKNGEDPENCTEVILREIECLIDKSNPEWKLVSAVANNLSAILSGNVSPTKVIFDDQLAKLFYDHVFKSLTGLRFQHLLALLSHENPCLRVIEVGAGTGAWSELILSIFREIERNTGGRSFSHYAYTDISPAFFDQARQVLSFDLPRIEFKVLDLERDVSQQGFELHSYDLVLAGSVFHATKDLTRTLRNVQRLLKPGGVLLTVEMTKPDDIVLNMVFGLLPGWWVFDDKWRHTVPNISEQQWDDLLKDTGFSGAELIINDYEDLDCHFSSVVMSRAHSTTPKRLTCEIVLVLSDQSTPQMELALELESALKNLKKIGISKVYIEQTNDYCPRKDDIVISLIEWGMHSSNILSPSFFNSTRKLVRNATNILWLTSTSKELSSYPFHHLMKGFFRSMRVEATEKRIIQLEIEACSSGSPAQIASILKVFYAAFETMHPDLEYCVENGTITTGRLIEEMAQNDKMNAFAYPQMRNETFVTSRPFELALGTPGVLDTLHFADDAKYGDNLNPGHVEILTSKWGMNFRDIFVALGQMEDDQLGCECSGVITRVGDGCGTDIQPGDKVCFISVGCFRTYIQTPVAAVTKIPKSVSPLAAVSVLCPGITAYQSLVNVARLCKGEKVLIHSGAGATGQLAIQIAQMLEADVFTTVGNYDKKKLIKENYKIADDHIFYSRNTAFEKCIKRVTHGYGVDVVLNSLSGDALRASWDCIAPYGRFIEIGKTDILANAALPMGNFQNNVSYSAVDINHIIRTKRNLATQLQTDILNLTAAGVLQAPAPIHEFSIGDIESAFRYFQSGTNTGRTVINLRESDLIRTYTRKQSTWNFDNDATYIIAGGLGGLGRAIISWMATKGAKHLIVPSRSGVSSQAASRTVDLLQQRGVHIATPTCDVSSEEELSGCLQAHAEEFPPIKGCINASLVLQDSLFENMSYEKWDLTIRSKAYSSWNLHRLLPDLDFFIQLSSLAGIVGPAAQSNYAAGCTFQDALARHRVSIGQKAISLDVGWMVDAGIVAETKAYQRYRQDVDDMQKVKTDDLLAVLEIYCDPSLPILPLEKSQLLIGLMTPAHRLSKGLPPTLSSEQPLYLGFSQPDASAASPRVENEVNVAKLFRDAKTLRDRASIVATAIASRLARALSTSVDNVELTKPFSDYGVDSLMAVELRNWIDKNFQANVAVFDIMDATSIESVGEIIALRTTNGDAVLGAHSQLTSP
ncbi:hypothetical protein NUW58_g268 [Xylaria curta]|uniref:Uncharacterized protein n=1 Tax=Xylaria curta TaxID=42375 RepID=A0ACC1PQU8_9PEZI|nr:hypothetical protein NUW58_g268 [Xylaria curta]